MAKLKAGERPKRPGSDRVKAQVTIPLDLLVRLDLLAGNQRRTRSALLEEWIAEKVRGVVIQYRTRPDEPVESAA